MAALGFFLGRATKNEYIIMSKVRAMALPSTATVLGFCFTFIAHES